MTDDRPAHRYGAIEDDYGHHIGYGCVYDHERWPCRHVRRIERQEQPRG